MEKKKSNLKAIALAGLMIGAGAVDAMLNHGQILPGAFAAIKDKKTVTATATPEPSNIETPIDIDISGKIDRSKVFEPDYIEQFYNIIKQIGNDSEDFYIVAPKDKDGHFCIESVENNDYLEVFTNGKNIVSIQYCNRLDPYNWESPIVGFSFARDKKSKILYSIFRSDDGQNAYFYDISEEDALEGVRCLSEASSEEKEAVFTVYYINMQEKYGFDDSKEAGKINTGAKLMCKK